MMCEQLRAIPQRVEVVPLALKTAKCIPMIPNVYNDGVAVLELPLRRDPRPTVDHSQIATRKSLGQDLHVPIAGGVAVGD